MEYTEKKSWLGQYLACRRKLEQDCAEIRRLRRLADGGVLMYGHFCARDRGKAGACIAEAQQQIALLQAEIPARVAQMSTLRQELGAAMNTLPENRLRLILQYRYCLGFTFAAVGKKVGYCEYYVSVLHKRALERLDI